MDFRSLDRDTHEWGIARIIKKMVDILDSMCYSINIINK